MNLGGGSNCYSRENLAKVSLEDDGHIRDILIYVSLK